MTLGARAKYEHLSHTGGFVNDDLLPGGVTRVRADNPGPMTLSGTNTYLIGEPAYVIDPGPSDERHIERVLSASRERGGIAGIVLTHRHLDHAGGAAALKVGADAPLAASTTRERVRSFEPEADQLAIDVELSEGEVFGPLRVLETPGHAADHLSFVAGEILFCGDTVLGEGSVFVPPGGGSMAAYLDSLRKLQTLTLTALCPGHGPVVHDPGAKLVEYLEHRLDRERRLVAALEQGLRGTDELLDAVWDDAPPVLRPAAALTLEAHLDKLEGERRLPDGVERLALDL
jgi:glyoxylase-like metal-dependent hydrolase (beta-lactamase superfamily II)